MVRSPVLVLSTASLICSVSSAISAFRLVSRPSRRRVKLGPGRTDAIDAVADLRALVDYRDQLVAERIAVANRGHAELSGLWPGYHNTIAR
jgi:transposase